MKYIKSSMSNPHQQNVAVAVMFQPEYQHDLFYGWLKCDPISIALLDSEPLSAGFLCFGREGLRSHGVSTSLQVDSKDEDGNFIMNTLLEVGGEFIKMENGDVVILTKGYHDFNNIDKQAPLEVRGSFSVHKGSKEYLELVPELKDIFIPKSKENSYDKEKLMSCIYDAINCD